MVSGWGGVRLFMSSVTLCLAAIWDCLSVFFLSWLLWDAACCWATSCLLSSSWPWDHHWPHRVVYGVGTKVSYIYLKCKGKSQPLNPSRPLGVSAVYTNTKSGQEDGGSRVCKFVELLLCGKHFVCLFSLGLCVRISSHFFLKVIQNDTESRFWKTQFCYLEPSIWNLDTADLVVLALPCPLAKQQQQKNSPCQKPHLSYAIQVVCRRLRSM